MATRKAGIDNESSLKTVFFFHRTEADFLKGVLCTEGRTRFKEHEEKADILSEK